MKSKINKISWSYLQPAYNMICSLMNNAEIFFIIYFFHIMQVLIHDPLYLWKLSPLKAQDIQRRTEEDTAASSRTHAAQKRGGGDPVPDNIPSDTNQPTNKMAERVLRRLHEKLEGEEDGMQLSVSGHVNHLIQEATDPGNLSALFHGWQSWV